MDMSNTFNVIGKLNGEINAFGIWEDTEENRQILAEWSELGYEETSEIYVQGHDGKFYIKGREPEYKPTYEEVQEARAEAYAREVDPLMSEYTRKKTFNLFEGNEEAELLAKIEAKVAEIKEANPYPA
jgi:glutamine amidotransferase-like uncharacterized protein